MHAGAAFNQLGYILSTEYCLLVDFDFGFGFGCTGDQIQGLIHARQEFSH